MGKMHQAASQPANNLFNQLGIRYLGRYMAG
jgi:hypothetical protein